jgi:hypothetical protein
MITEWPKARWRRRAVSPRGVVQLVDGVDDQGGVHDGAVDDRFRRKGLDAQALEGELALALLQLDELHRRAADIEPYETFRA